MLINFCFNLSLVWLVISSMHEGYLLLRYHINEQKAIQALEAMQIDYSRESEVFKGRPGGDAEWELYRTHGNLRPPSWMIALSDYLNRRILKKNHQIKLGEWRVFDPISDISNKPDSPEVAPVFSIDNINALQHLKFLEDVELYIRGSADRSMLLLRFKDFQYLHLILAAFENFNDESLAEISTIRNLSVLNITNTPITDKGVEHLRGHPSLIEINLECTYVTDNCLPVFETIPFLEHLNVSQAKVNPDGMAIKRLRERNPTLDVACIVYEDEEYWHLFWAEDKKNENREELDDLGESIKELETSRYETLSADNILETKECFFLSPSIRGQSEQYRPDSAIFVVRPCNQPLPRLRLLNFRPRIGHRRNR